MIQWTQAVTLRFVECWRNTYMAGGCIGIVARRFRITNGAARARATFLRRKGVELPNMRARNIDFGSMNTRSS